MIGAPENVQLRDFHVERFTISGRIFMCTTVTSLLTCYFAFLVQYYISSIYYEY